jgi:hypothetical protein
MAKRPFDIARWAFFLFALIVVATIIGAQEIIFGCFWVTSHGIAEPASCTAGSIRSLVLELIAGLLILMRIVPRPPDDEQDKDEEPPP